MTRTLLDTTTATRDHPTLPPPRARAKLDGVTVVVPCLNEEGSIADTVREVSSVLLTAKRPFEVIVVDDGSTDASVERLKRIGADARLKIMRNTRNRGYGYSLKRAIDQAAFETVVITDADGTYPNHRIAELVDLLDGVDMVVGARTGANVHIPPARRPAKWFLRRLASYLAETRIPDLNSGFRVMKRSLVRKFMHLLPDGFSFTTTITLALLTHGYEVRYEPIDYARRVGRSSIRPVRDTMNFLNLIVRTVMYFKPLKIFGPASALMFALALAVALVSKFVYGALADVTAVTLATNIRSTAGDRSARGPVRQAFVGPFVKGIPRGATPRT